MHRAINSTAIQGFGYRHFGPFVLEWYNRLVNSCGTTSGPIFLLGRDGWNLVPLFNTFEALREKGGNRFVYLPTSRALLSHIALSEPLLQSHVFGSTFNGSVKDFFECRLGLPFLLFQADEWASLRISLPRDRDLLEAIFDRARTQAEAVSRASKDAYGKYLRKRGLEQSRKIIISDLGFRGNSQAILAMVYNLNLTGYYALLDPSGVTTPLQLQAGSAFGLFSDAHSFGSGYAPLDESLLFEAFLTAPFGQVIGIEPDGRTDPFLYRSGSKAQTHFGIIAETMQGAMKFAFDHEDLIGSDEAIITDFESFFDNLKNELRKKVNLFRPIFEIDDSFFGSQLFDAEIKLWTA